MGTRSAAIQIRAPSTSPSLTPSSHPAPASTSTPSVSSQSSDRKISADGFHPDTDRLAPRPPICRNVLLYGSCKYEKEGTCRFSHQASAVTGHGRKSNPSSPRKFSLPHPARPATATPMGFATGTLTTSAPVFVPGGAVSQSNVNKAASQVKLNMSAAEFEPSGLPHNDVGKYLGRTKDHLDEPTSIYNQSSTSDPAPSYPISSSTPYPSTELQFQPHNPYAYETDHLHHQHSDGHSFNENYIGQSHVTGPSLSNFQRPLNYHLYAPPLPHSSNQHPDLLASNSFFMPASIRETLQRKSAATLQGPTHEVARSPEDLGVYHSLVVIDSPHSNPNPTISHNSLATTAALSSSSGLLKPTTNHHQSSAINNLMPRSPYFSKVFKNPSWIYKTFCSLDGKAYCLYRIEGVQLQQGQGEVAIGQVERWRKIRHPSVVNIREAFTTRAFGDQSIVFAFDYHPLSQSLYDEHISSRKKNTFSFGNSPSLETDHASRTHFNGNPRYQSHRSVNGHSTRSGLLKEGIIWSYVMQIANAIKTVHLANLAVRTIECTKILLTGANRVRINGCGILDVIEYSPTQSLEELKVNDLRDLGCLICSIASSSDCSRINPMTISQGMEYVKQFYSRELNDVVNYLLKSSPDITIDGLLAIVWHRGFEEMTRVFNHNDLLEEYLARELENGRLVRLMTKLGFINERPEFDHDPNWSETSERYLLKLFRDYVFHQVDALGKPVTDLSHVLTCLNKLDASLDEKITLISRDDQTCAVVSYAEIRRIMDLAFRDLSR